MKKYLFSCLLCLASCIYTSHAQPTKKNHQLDSLITAYLAEVNVDSVESDIQGLQDLGTRYAYASNHRDVAEWIKKKFVSFGYTNAVLDSFYCYSHDYDTATWQYNVVATLVGSQNSDKYFVLGAHYDSGATESSFVLAPGADDNASGVSGVLEVARVMKLKGYQPGYSIQFVTFTTEETGMSGSYYYIDKAKATNMDIEMMINLDMIAYEPDTVADSVTLVASTNSKWVSVIADTIRQKYTTLAPIYGNSLYGDATIFWDNGYVAFEMTESFSTGGWKYPHYHHTTDVVANCNVGYCAEVIKITLGTLLQVDKLDSILGIDNKQLYNFSLHVYPNPSNGIFNLTINTLNNNHTTIEVYNIGNQKIYEGTTDYNSFSDVIDLSDYPKGVYILKVQNNEGIELKKIVIQ